MTAQSIALRERIQAIITSRTEELAAERDEALADAEAISEQWAQLHERHEALHKRYQALTLALRALDPSVLEEFSLAGFLADDNNDEATP